MTTRNCLLLSFSLLLPATENYAQSIYTPYAFTNFAGQPGTPGYADATGSAALFNLPHGMAVDNAGNVYVADTQNQTIRQISPAGVVTTIAGRPGNQGNVDGFGQGAAQFNAPIGISVDNEGNLYVGDTSNDTIRKIDPDGTVSTLAGQPGVTGSSNGIGSGALFKNPEGTAVDAAGNIYVADDLNRTIRKITPGGDVSTLAGKPGTQGTNDGTGSAASFNQPVATWRLDSATNVYVVDPGADTIRKITPDGAVTTLAGAAGKSGTNDGLGSAARFFNPQAVAFDAAGDLFVTDLGSFTIRKVTPEGDVSTVAGSPGQSGSTDGTNNTVLFADPRGVAVDGATNVYVADSGAIRELTMEGSDWVSSTIAGAAGQNGSLDGIGSAARFHNLYSLTVDSATNLYVIDRANDTIRKISPVGTNWLVKTVAGVPGLAGSADGTGAAAEFSQPVSLAVDGATNIYVADFQNESVRKISPSGTNWVVTTLAGTSGKIGTNDGPGYLALFSQFHGVAVDGAQNVYVTDTGNLTIRKITPDGIVSTYAGKAGAPGLVDDSGAAARFGDPDGVVSDAPGNLYVLDGNWIRKITPDAAVTTIAGCPGGCTNAIGSTDGAGAMARFDAPIGIALDGASNVYVADAGNDTIRKLTPSGGDWMVTTLAGSPGQSGAADGVGPDARFNLPSGIAVDEAGNVYVGDTEESRITKGVVATTTPVVDVQIDTSVGSLSVSNGSFNLKVITSSGGNVILETSTNLQTWMPIQTNAVASGTIDLSTLLNGAPQQFFRVYLTP